MLAAGLLCMAPALAMAQPADQKAAEQQIASLNRFTLLSMMACIAAEKSSWFYLSRQRSSLQTTEGHKT
jgi:hypothetical protein